MNQCINISLAAALLFTSAVEGQITNPVCYVCGGDSTATVSNSDVLIDIPPELNSAVPQASCLQIYQAGLDRLITVEQCDAILRMVDTQIICGCTNIVGPAPTSIPASLPVPAPIPIEKSPQAIAPTETEPPVEIPTNIETDTPGTAMPNPLDEGIEAPTKCKGKGKGGNGKGENSSRGKGKKGKMGKKCKKPKEPSTPKTGKEMNGKVKGKGKGLRI